MKNTILIVFLISVILNSYLFGVYNPKTGRFQQQDPIGYADGMNMYEYVKGNPISHSDPMGLTSFAGNANPTVFPNPDPIIPDSWWNNPFTQNEPQFIGPQISPQVSNVYNKLKSACKDSCVCNAGEGCTKPKCESEAMQIARAYVAMWNQMAENENSYYRSQVPEGTGPSTAGQTYGDSHCGWMCYHWRTHTYNALAPLQKDFNCFKSLRSGTSRTTQIDEPIAVIHNWVTVSVGSINEPEGECSLRLDPWHGFGPGVFSDSEHPYTPNFYINNKGEGCQFMYDNNGKYLGLKCSPNWVGDEDWGDAKPYLQY